MLLLSSLSGCSSIDQFVAVSSVVASFVLPAVPWSFSIHVGLVYFFPPFVRLMCLPFADPGTCGVSQCRPRAGSLPAPLVS